MNTRVVDDPAELVALFERDRHIHIYALADLEEPYWSASTWWRNGDAVVGLVGLPGGSSIVYAVSSVDAAGTLALASEVADHVPPTLVTGVPAIAFAFEAAGRGIVWQRGYNRYHLTDPSLVPVPDGRVVPLGSDDLDTVLALYDVDPGAAFFLPNMLDDDTFVGVQAGDDLVAIAGTHVLSTQHDVAAVGAVFTHPEHRGQGLGAAVTAGVIHRIGDRVRTIGLNCAQANTVARSIYLKMGFAQSMAYDECELASAPSASGAYG